MPRIAGEASLVMACGWRPFLNELTFTVGRLISSFEATCVQVKCKILSGAASKAGTHSLYTADGRPAESPAVISVLPEAVVAAADKDVDCTRRRRYGSW